MRTNLKFLLLALLIISGKSNVWAYGEDDLKSAGWTEVTTLPTSNEELSKYYYVFYATEADLMLAEENGEGKEGDEQEKQLTIVYRTPVDPGTDKTKVWTLEYSNSWNYGLRSLAYPTHFIQTRENATWRVQAAWETSQSMWTRWDFVYANGSWTIENKLQDDKRDNDAKNKNVYIGPWNETAFKDNMVVAGNKTGNNVGHFKIYSILRSSLASIDDFNAAKEKFSALKNQTEAYTDNNGAVQTFENAISAAESKAKDGSPKDIAEAIENVKQAAVTFLQSVTVNSGKSFDVTAFITNPDFADNNTEGWDKTVAGTTRAQCHEYFNTTFDISQTLTGLPVGSYSLSVQAFTRPGGNAAAYKDYKDGINNVHAELYVNSNASKVGNIYDYKGNTTGAKVKDDDYQCDGYWVPNGMEGANLYFKDPEVYKTTVVALVEDGNLKIGFRDKELTENQWTIFSNFHLYYYGESKIIYYQQYLPQLKEEVSADLENGAYVNVKGQERTALEEALKKELSGTTDEAYEALINEIKKAQETFQAAKAAYDAFVNAVEANYDTTLPYAGKEALAAFNAASEAETPTSAEEAEAKANAITSAYRKYVESNALAKGVDGATLIEIDDANMETGYNDETKTFGAWAVFEQTNGTIQLLENQSFTDGDGKNNYQYADIYKDDNNAGIKQTVSLEPGKYILTVTARADNTEGAAFWVFAGSATTNIPRIGNQGGVFGRGWNDVTVEFNVESEQDVEIGVQSGNGKSLWWSATRFRLTRLGDADYEVEVTDAGYATYVAPADIEFKNDAYVIFGLDDEEENAVLTPVASVKKDTPVIIAGAGKHTFVATKNADEINGTNLLKVAPEAGVTVAEGIYVLANIEKPGFYALDDEKITTLPSGTVYLQWAAASGDTDADEVKFIGFVFGDGATAIKGVETPAAQDGIYYNLSGQRVQAPTKGIYIVNGKKVLVK